uniref:Uncharacterized protein n=1 Tax=Odontella aurita TaxID=265563 RepID=A0A7S4NDV0_9STRA
MTGVAPPQPTGVLPDPVPRIDPSLWKSTRIAQKYSSQSHNWGFTTTNTKVYNNLNFHIRGKPVTVNDLYHPAPLEEFLISQATEQMSMNWGLKFFGQAGLEEVHK